MCEPYGCHPKIYCYKGIKRLQGVITLFFNVILRITISDNLKKIIVKTYDNDKNNKIYTHIHIIDFNY